MQVVPVALLEFSRSVMRERFSRIQALGTQAAFATPPPEQQRAYVDVSLAQWDLLDCDEKINWVPEDFRQFLVDDVTPITTKHMEQSAFGGKQARGEDCGKGLYDRKPSMRTGKYERKPGMRIGKNQN